MLERTRAWKRGAERAEVASGGDRVLAEFEALKTISYPTLLSLIHPQYRCSRGRSCQEFVKKLSISCQSGDVTHRNLVFPRALGMLFLYGFQDALQEFAKTPLPFGHHSQMHGHE